MDDEFLKGYQNNKKLLREYENVTRPLERSLPTNLNEEEKQDDDLRQFYAWKRYILWEKQNPFKLEGDILLLQRVKSVYEQSLSRLAFHVDIWYEFALYLINQKQVLKESSSLSEDEISNLTEKAAADLYERAISSTMKNNILIHLIYADFEEGRKNYKKVTEIFEKCIQNEDIKDPTLLWIHYIYFKRRTEDVNSARKLFKRSREDQRITYHLFIANALLEYYCTKDKAIGFKILHLGAKRFGHDPEYMLAFIKYMSHLNEDNNARVLFEKILTTEEIPLYKTNEIWSEFLKFECEVGDLASILKVDKKRKKLFESLQNNPLNEITQSSLMIDRYKYLDMYPCNTNELKSMGYKDSRISTQLTPIISNQSLSSIFSNNVSISQAELAIVAANELKRAKYPVPDTSQMLPFKPIRNPMPSMMHPISGGVFPFPPQVTELVKRLPPPNAFEGPFVKIDEFLKKFQEIEVNEDFQPLYVYVNGEPIKECDHLLSGGVQLGLKRALISGDSDDEDLKKSKTMDIYKQRQYKKLIQK